MRLGEHGYARASRMWVRTTLWLLFVFVIMQAVFQNEPVMQFGGLYFLVITWASWMVTTGWEADRLRARTLRQRLPPGAPRPGHDLRGRLLGDLFHGLDFDRDGHPAHGA